MPIGLTFKLPKGATIIVAGAYHGLVMDLLSVVYSDYGKMIGFEPVEESIKEAWVRLSSKRDVTLVPYGLGTRSGAKRMHQAGTIFSSFHRGRGAPPSEEEYEFHEIGGVFRQLGLECVDLLVLNVEGDEWSLIPHMVRDGWINQGFVKRLMVQFHEGLGEDMPFEEIAHVMQRSHKRVYDEYPSWVLWEYSGAPWR